MAIEAPYFKDPTRIQYELEAMDMRGGKVAQKQRSTRWFVRRLDGTLLDCGLEAEGKKLATEMLLTWEGQNQ